MVKSQKRLSPLEHRVMEVIWERGPSTANEIRDLLKRSHPLKESTVRTLLRRMEAKGFITHTVEGRTFRYRERIKPQRAAAQAVRQVMDRFCQGSVESLLAGMVSYEILKPEQLRELAEKLSRADLDTNSGKE